MSAHSRFLQAKYKLVSVVSISLSPGHFPPWLVVQLQRGNSISFCFSQFTVDEPNGMTLHGLLRQIAFAFAEMK